MGAKLRNLDKLNHADKVLAPKELRWKNTLAKEDRMNSLNSYGKDLEP